MKIFIFFLLLPLSSYALKPCHDGTWTADRKRPAAKWKEISTWVAKGKITKYKEKLVPYPNCGLKDRSRCSMWDRSSITVKIEKWEKGKGENELVLQSAYCAPPPSSKTDQEIRIYGTAQDQKSFTYFEIINNDSK